MPTVDLTISITNIDHRDMLRDLLQSICENTNKISYEIIVVDNVSQDDSVEMVHREFPDVRVIELKERIGYGPAHNRSLEFFNGRYFLIFNEDMKVLPGALDTMVNVMDREQGLGALGCRLLRGDGSLIFSCSDYHTLTSELLGFLVPPRFVSPDRKSWSRILDWDYDTNRDVNVISGCCMMIPRQVIERIGLFDEYFFVYTEEFDLCKRISDGGWRVHFTPDAEIIHYGGQTGKKISARAYSMMLESRLKFFKKHHGNTQALLVRSIYFVGISARLFGWFFVRILKLRPKEVATERLNTYSKGLLWLFGLYQPY